MEKKVGTHHSLPLDASFQYATCRFPSLFKPNSGNSSVDRDVKKCTKSPHTLRWAFVEGVLWQSRVRQAVGSSVAVHVQLGHSKQEQRSHGLRVTLANSSSARSLGPRPALWQANNGMKIRIKLRPRGQSAVPNGGEELCNCTTAPGSAPACRSSPVATSSSGYAPRECSTAALHARSLLQGYVAPSASAGAIVNALRHEAVQPLIAPCWDSLAIPEALEAFATERCSSSQVTNGAPSSSLLPRSGRGLKRPRADRYGQEQTAEAAGSNGHDDDQIDAHLRLKRPAAREEVEEARPSMPESPQDVQPAAETAVAAPAAGCCSPSADLKQGPQHSCAQVPTHAEQDASDQTNLTAPYFPSSPEQGACVQDSRGTQTAASFPSSPEQGACMQNSRATMPSAACQAGPGILPSPSYLSYQGSSHAAGHARFSSISVFDLSTSSPPPQHVDADALLAKATSLKRSADQVRGGSSAPWTVQALCIYLESAVTFMEACECISSTPGTSQSQDRGGRLASLYGSTAALLSYSARAAESSLGPSLCRHALRVLAERLCALCQLREAAAAPGRFADAAARAKQLGGGAAAAAAQRPPTQQAQARGSTGKPQAPSSQLPGSSSAPAHTHVAAPAAAPAADGLQRLLERARQVARFSDTLQRSTKGLQALVDRPDFGGSRQAQLVALHMAAVSMDGVGGRRLLSHARCAAAAIVALCDAPQG